MSSDIYYFWKCDTDMGSIQMHLDMDTDTLNDISEYLNGYFFFLKTLSMFYDNYVFTE